MSQEVCVIHMSRWHEVCVKMASTVSCASSASRCHQLCLVSCVLCCVLSAVSCLLCLVCCVLSAVSCQLCQDVIRYVSMPSGVRVKMR